MNDNLINRIVYLISNYIEANEPSDLDAFLYNIINCIIEENNVKNYVNEIKILDFYEKNHSSLGKLDCDNNLCVFKKGIENDVNKILIKFQGFSDFENILCMIMLYIKTITHEVHHLKQKKLLAEDLQNVCLETQIVKLSQENSDEGYVNDIGYFINYDIHPIERIAEITSRRFVVAILEKFGDKAEKLKNYMKKIAIYEEFYYYYKYGFTGPTMIYLNFYADEKEMLKFKDRIRCSDITLEDRLLYGLEITEDEYRNLVMVYAMLEDKLGSATKKKK